MPLGRIMPRRGIGAAEKRRLAAKWQVGKLSVKRR